MPPTIYGANLMMDVAMGLTQSPPTTFYVALLLDPATYTTEDGADLEEPVGAGYARVAVPNDAAHWAEAADGFKSNAQDIIFPMATDTWGNIRWWAICDAATGGNVLFWGGASSRLVLTGTTLRFVTDTLSITAR